ncbi:MAG: SxtJ family membrane protein [cyanobacterium endosymbiont of Rhopalodia musculus]|uniref:SxtJ family membrane protein n=1 Tax=cyanobacterium endosymbiont of Epithemia clementina EcSB TaxID=3034674 RepID=UPI002480F04A|nr:SxtJ family membrane protein [cyanobacterium endosymbiont of Epithemia clementina EcSB]WGT68118.1 SxtJ family membrane protein [cyanobacterium endosymbiont of Epithemia clementina EcSB]
MSYKIPKLNRKELRRFGLLTGTIISGLFGLVMPLISGDKLPLTPWIITGVMYGLATFIPQSLDPIYNNWMKVTQVLAWINTRIILGLIFFLIITPMAFIMQLFNRDTMKKISYSLETYRISSFIKEKNSMEKPY